MVFRQTQDHQTGVKPNILIDAQMLPEYKKTYLNSDLI